MQKLKTILSIATILFLILLIPIFSQKMKEVYQPQNKVAVIKPLNKPLKPEITFEEFKMRYNENVIKNGAANEVTQYLMLDDDKIIKSNSVYRQSNFFGGIEMALKTDEESGMIIEINIIAQPFAGKSKSEKTLTLVTQ